MEILWEELSRGMPDYKQAIQVLTRLAVAVLLGAVIGYQRERARKPAGLRTHILVTLGTCIFVLACAAYGMSSDGLSRVIQGIVTGIGFVGAGSILKLDEQENIKGLTTATSVWMASAIGVAVGLGVLGLALFGTILSLAILALAGKFEVDDQKDEGKKA